MDALFAPADPISAQVAAAIAEDLATEDTLTALERAVDRGALKPEAHLKHVRQLSKRQFIARVTVARAAQQQRAGSKAGPAPSFGGELPLSGVYLLLPITDGAVTSCPPRPGPAKPPSRRCSVGM